MSEPFLGEIRTFAGNFAPTGWAICDGSVLAIARATALYSLLGTTFGGDGKTTFGLPNLMGAAPMHWGDGPGLTPRNIGETNGATTVTLTSSQIPGHSHAFNASGAAADQTSPANNELADAALYSQPPYTAAMAPQTIGLVGGSQPHENRQPYLGVTFIIALEGIFPSRG